MEALRPAAPVEPMRPAMAAPAASSLARPVDPMRPAPLASATAPPVGSSSTLQSTGGAASGSFASRTLQPLQFNASPGSLATPLNGSAAPTPMPGLAPVTTLRPKLGF